MWYDLYLTNITFEVSESAEIILLIALKRRKMFYVLGIISRIINLVPLFLYEIAM